MEYFCDILEIFLWYSWNISVIFLCQLVAFSLIRCGPKVIEATWRRQSRIGDKKWGIICCVRLCQTWLDWTPPNISSWPPCLTHRFNGNDEILFGWMLKIQLWELIQGGWVLWSKVSKRSPILALILKEAPTRALIKKQKRFLPLAMLRPLYLLLILTRP